MPEGPHWFKATAVTAVPEAEPACSLCGVLWGRAASAAPVARTPVSAVMEARAAAPVPCRSAATVVRAAPAVMELTAAVRAVTAVTAGW